MAFIIDKQELADGLVIFRRGDVEHDNWYCRIKIPKQDRYKTISLETPNVVEATQMAFRHDGQIHNQIENKIPIFGKTFAQVAEEYGEFHKTSALAGEITMERVKTVASYIKHHLLPYLGDTPITRVGKEQWAAYPVWRKTEGGNIVIKKGKRAKKGEKAPPDEKKIVPAKDGAIRQEMKSFRAILNFAADKEYIRDRQVPRGNIPLEDGRREAFTAAEYKHLHTFARTKWINKERKGLKPGDPPQPATETQVWYRKMVYQFMLVMTNTGMRPSEAKNLRWRDFDIRKAKDGREFVCLSVRGKGKKRELVAGPSVATYLQKVRELAENPPPQKGDAARDDAQHAKKTIKLDDFIFTNAKGESATDHYKRLITDLVTDAGLLMSPTGMRRSTYCFRHTYATFRLIEGVDVIWLAKQMGTSVKMIEKHYGHITPTTDAGRILQGTPGWEPVADGSGETTDSVNADGAGAKPAKPRKK